MKISRKWAKIGYGLMLAGVIGILLELLFWIPNMEVGWKDIAAVGWMVVNIVLAFGGLSLLKWKCRCPHGIRCGRAAHPGVPRQAEKQAAPHRAGERHAGGRVPRRGGADDRGRADCELPA